MTIELLVSDIMDAISHLSIDGVVVRDVDEIAKGWRSMPNVLYPNPENMIIFAPPVYASLMQGDGAPTDFNYVLNYRFLGTQIGNIGDVTGFPLMFGKVMNIYQEIAKAVAPLTPTSGKAFLNLGRVSIGQRFDPVGTSFNGADFELRIMEQYN